MGGFGEGGVDQVGVAEFPVEHDVAGSFVVQHRRAGGGGGAGGGDGGEGFDVRQDRLGGVRACLAVSATTMAIGSPT